MLILAIVRIMRVANAAERLRAVARVAHVPRERVALLCAGERVMRALQAAATRIGVTLADYLAHRAAGEQWCSRCKSWRSDVRRAECRPCRVVLDRERRQRTEPAERRPQAAVLAAYAASSSTREMARRLGCSVRTVNRDLHAYGLRSFGQPAPAHPPVRWCSCEACLAVRRVG